jgi:hypothetical protein
MSDPSIAGIVQVALGSLGEVSIWPNEVCSTPDDGHRLSVYQLCDALRRQILASPKEVRVPSEPRVTQPAMQHSGSLFSETLRVGLSIRGFLEKEIRS